MLKSRKSKIAGLVIGGILLAGSIAGVASADPNAQNTKTKAMTSYYQEFVADLAANLGVSQDQVTTALEATKKQMLQEAVQQGRITQDQADKMAARKGFGFGMCDFRPMKQGKQGRGDITNNANFLNNAAGVLGITADELKSELQSGKTLQQIIADHNLTMDQFRQKMPHRQRKDNSAGSITSAVDNASN